MVQGTRRAPGGSSLSRKKVLNRKSASRQKVALAKMVSSVGKKGKGKSSISAKIKKKLQTEISSRIEQELRAKATQDGNTFKILSLKPKKLPKKSALNKKKTNIFGKKIIRVNGLDTSDLNEPGPSTQGTESAATDTKDN